MAVTANQLITARNPGNLVGIPVAASTNIYEGTIVFYDASTGYATVDDNSGANAVAGIAKAQQDNSSGSAGDLTVEVYQEGEFELVGSSFTQANAGDVMHATDNYTIAASGGSAIGRATEFISTTKLMIKLDI